MKLSRQSRLESRQACPRVRRTHALASGVSAAGFTLVELLVCVAIVAALSGIVLGASRHALENGRVSRTRAELATLAAALESYRLAHGDFPHTSDAAALLQSLLGRRSPGGAGVTTRALIEISRFDLSADPFADPTAHLRDAWGTAYRYAYRSQEPWTNPSYVLYSCGPDRAAYAALLAGGFVEQTEAANEDNLSVDLP